MRFTKMQGLGNDYVYVDGFRENLAQPARAAQVVSDRHFGIGADGLILILPSERADVRMRMFNADGSEAQMCGNGVRCVAKYAYEHQLTAGRAAADTPARRLLQAALPGAREFRELSVETGRGVLTLCLGLAGAGGKAGMICVDMDEPILLPARIPVAVTGQQAVGIPLAVDNLNLLMTCVSMGNPHAVFFVPDAQAIDLARVGPMIERHRLFPERVNAHFVQVVSPAEVIMRTWERGSGITLACGTGAAAVCVAGILASKTQRQIRAHLPGGDLELLWHEPDNHVYMAGPAVEVFAGEIDLK